MANRQPEVQGPSTKPCDLSEHSDTGVKGLDENGANLGGPMNGTFSRQSCPIGPDEPFPSPGTAQASRPLALLMEVWRMESGARPISGVSPR